MARELTLQDRVSIRRLLNAGEIEIAIKLCAAATGCSFAMARALVFQFNDQVDAPARTDRRRARNQSAL